MYKYLVVSCDEDYNKEPVCLIQEKDLNKYGYGFEIYEVQKNGKLKLYKESDITNDSGFCVVLMHDTDDRSKWTVLEKYSTNSRENFVETSIFKEWCNKYFYEDFDEIKEQVSHQGCHCSEEPDEDSDYAITEFKDNLIYYPY